MNQHHLRGAMGALSAIVLAVTAQAQGQAITETTPEASRSGRLEPQFVERLRQLATSQGDRYAARRDLVEMPQRPDLAATGALELPERFCSGEERNAFHDLRFIPLVERASRNNMAAIAYMELLQRLATEATERGDSNTANAMAFESSAYSPVARSAYDERMALDGVFRQMLAVPVTACDGARP